MKTVNRKLNELYHSLLDTDDTPFGKDDLSMPQLLNFDDEAAIETADLRVMFFGQELYGGEFEPIDRVMDVYRLFFNDFKRYSPMPEPPNENCWNKDMAVFWRVMERMKLEIDGRLPNKKIFYIWNNITKACYKERRVPRNIYKTFREINRSLILGEIEIIKPDVMVFFTGGWRRDYAIDDVFNNGNEFYKEDIDVDGNKNILAKAHLPKYGDAYVTYHPRGLQMKGRKVIDFVISSIAEQCALIADK